MDRCTGNWYLHTTSIICVCVSVFQCCKMPNKASGEKRFIAYVIMLTPKSCSCNIHQHKKNGISYPFIFLIS
jgi:hypothetical protein